MKSNQDFEKIKLIIETVNYEINSYTPWVARKEIAAWAALVLYLALIGAIIGFLFKNLNYDISFIEIILLLIPSAIFIIILSIIFASFIHSQFSSIYDKQALTQALRKNIYWLLSKTI